MLGVARKAPLRVLLVEDDTSLCTSLSYSLEASGYEVRIAGSGEDAIASVSAWPPDLVLLDIMLPGISGFEVCRQIRGRKDIRQPAIIIVTAKTQETDRVACFEVGADDFVAKPFSLSELLLRIQARLHSHPTSEYPAIAAPSPAPPQPKLRIAVGPLEIDQASHRVFLAKQELNLSVQEMRLLTYLASESGKMRTRRDLLTMVWGYHPDATSRTLDTHIKRLRDKFGPLASMLQTVHGVGYRLTEPSEREPNAGTSGKGQRRR
jgi:two-component system, OmpR family, phosphate regulon response regulator PhoB